MSHHPDAPDTTGSGWLVFAVLLLAVAVLRFIYHTALLTVPLEQLIRGALN